MKTKILTLCFAFSAMCATAQTPNECLTNGTLLFKEDFGGNSESDPEISIISIGSRTSYNFCTSDSCLGNANNTYMITKKSPTHIVDAWQSGYSDHTYPNDVTKGYMYAANAATGAGVFYQHQMNGLCENISLYFSAWLANLCTKERISSPIDPSMRFEIYDLGGNLLRVYSTGVIPRTAMAEGLVWKQYGFYFAIPSGVTSVNLKIVNEAVGNSGNDFVMDDIEIRLCVPPVNTVLPTTVNVGSSTTLKANYTDNGTFGNNLKYRWEYSETGEVNGTWTEVPNAAGTSNTGTINAEDIIANFATSNDGFYRCVVIGINNSFEAANNCRAISEIKEIEAIICALPKPTITAKFKDPASNPYTAELTGAWSSTCETATSKGFEYKMTTESTWTDTAADSNFKADVPNMKNGTYEFRSYVVVNGEKIYSNIVKLIVQCKTCG